MQYIHVQFSLLFVAGHGACPGDLADPGLLLGAVGVRAVGAAHEQLRAHPRSLQGRSDEFHSMSDPVTD